MIAIKQWYILGPLFFFVGNFIYTGLEWWGYDIMRYSEPPNTWPQYINIIWAQAMGAKMQGNRCRISGKGCQDSMCVCKFLATSINWLTTPLIVVIAWKHWSLAKEMILTPWTRFNFGGGGSMDPPWIRHCFLPKWWKLVASITLSRLHDEDS